MNKKSLLMMMLTICLIAVVGVGATLAYLTDTSKELKNTFTMGKVDITLTENGQDEGEGLEFTNIIPGMTMTKSPVVTVDKDSADAFVFMSVTGFDEKMTGKFTIQYKINNDFFEGININDWKKIDDSEGIDGIYVYVGGDEDAKAVSMKEETEDKALAALFDQVTYLTTNTENSGTAEYEIIVKAAAIQSENNSYDTAKNEAQILLTSVAND